MREKQLIGIWFFAYALQGAVSSGFIPILTPPASVNLSCVPGAFADLLAMYICQGYYICVILILFPVYNLMLYCCRLPRKLLYILEFATTGEIELFRIVSVPSAVLLPVPALST